MRQRSLNKISVYIGRTRCLGCVHGAGSSSKVPISELSHKIHRGQVIPEPHSPSDNQVTMLLVEHVCSQPRSFSTSFKSRSISYSFVIPPQSQELATITGAHQYSLCALNEFRTKCLFVKRRCFKSIFW